MDQGHASDPKQNECYPMTARKKIKGFKTDSFGPVSGCFEGKFSSKQVEKANLELKVDVDKISEHSEVLNVVSGTIVKSSGEFLKMKSEKSLFFRSVNKTVVFNESVEASAGYDKEVSCDILVTRENGVKYCGKSRVLLKYDYSARVWKANCKVLFEGEAVTFVCIRKSSHFRKIAVDIDYVEKVVWPTVTLSDFYDVPLAVKDRKIDPFVVFADAGIKLSYDSKDSDRISDPTPHNPWTKNDMYELMIANYDKHSSGIETLWCMMANQPPDHRYMGYSFDHKGRHGFGLFLGHKAFEGLDDKTHDNYSYATRKFLHYFVHECGHALGLVHPFEIGKSHELTWMNYAWKYDHEFGAGKFYGRFRYSFARSELEVLRHSPGAAFIQAKSTSVQVSQYGMAKAPIGQDHLGDSDDEEDEDMETDAKLSLRITVREEPYRLNELVELEVRIKNVGDVATMVERDLSIEEGHLHLYVTYPDGKVKICRSFMRLLSGSSLLDPVLLYPQGSENEQDRHTQLISVGEGEQGAEFNVAGKYKLQAVYQSGGVKLSSHHVDLKVIEGGYQSVAVKAEPTYAAPLLNVLSLFAIMFGVDGLPKDENDTRRILLNASFLLGRVSHSHSHSVLDDWRFMVKCNIEEKKNLVHKIISVAEEILLKDVRVIKRQGHETVVHSQTVSLTHGEFIAETNDLLQYYHTKGIREDSIHYKQLVIARAKVQVCHDCEKSDSECSQLVADLILRGVKYTAITSIMQEYKKLKKPKVTVKKATKEFYQKKVEEILEWYPKKRVEHRKDLSGLGLGTFPSQFNNDHIVATAKIVRMLFDKLDETNDLKEVLDHADNLQRSYQVNHHVLQWAVEIFVIHSKVAKKSGILYPEPPDKDVSFTADAAMIVTKRTGTPQETWMNYWRMDADLNFHHRHWHKVYAIRNHISSPRDWFGRWKDTAPELERQGELFAYMHQQMLARYDAERESWGLSKVQEWDLKGEDTLGFNAGFEFHSDQRNYDVSPRPPASWPPAHQQSFQAWEDNYKLSVNNGVLPELLIPGRPPLRLQMDFNLAGHVLEASSELWRGKMGNMHNMGHGVFGNNQGKSYMYSTVTAMRDPIFYRWHKRIDNLWQYWNHTQVTEIGEDCPPVEIRSCDILIKKQEVAAEEFHLFSNKSLVSDEMSTFLGPPQKKYEWENKIGHDPFYYHIRFRRTAPGDLSLTFRIFICPLREINNRQMWIEMDKFVYRLPSSEDTAVIVRPDRHSSVIKRIPAQMEGNVEGDDKDLHDVSGFCECGWPYNMLLPRGTSKGEEWRLCVFVSDNNLDSIKVKSTCGSLSFCGASGEAYPDRRPMGYPFTTDVSVKGKEVKIEEAIESLHNSAMSSFVIRNNIVTESQAVSKVDMWSPWLQLGLNDGTNGGSSEITLYRPSKATGRIRVLVKHDSMTMPDRFGRYSIRFQGRGGGNGTYRVSNATIAWRSQTSVSIASGTSPQVLKVSGEESFDVHEYGLVTDEVHLDGHGEDLFVTFTLTSPGCFLRGSRTLETSTWMIFDPTGEEQTSNDWDGLARVRRSPSICCVGAVMIPIPE